MGVVLGANWSIVHSISLLGDKPWSSFGNTYGNLHTTRMFFNDIFAIQDSITCVKYALKPSIIIVEIREEGTTSLSFPFKYNPS